MAASFEKSLFCSLGVGESFFESSISITNGDILEFCLFSPAQCQFESINENVEVDLRLHLESL